MDPIKILKRAFNITKGYRALWVFGIILALTAGGGSNVNGSSSGGGSGGSSTGGSLPPAAPEIQIPGAPEFTPLVTFLTANLIPIIIVFSCIFLALIVVGTILRYVSEAALVRMVNQHEASGEKVGVRQGFRLGWSRAAFRLWVIDLVLGLSLLLGFLLLGLIVAAPLLVWLTENQVARIIGTVTTAGLGILLILAAIIVSIAVSLATQLIRRVCVLEGLGVMDSIRRGFRMARQRLGDVLLMGILLFALGLLWAFAMIPVVIVLVLAGGVIGGLPGLLAGGLTYLFSQDLLPVIVGLAVGLPLFLLALILPLTFLGGLSQTYISTTWTLVYRELAALESGAGLAPAGPAADAAELPVENAG